MSLPLSTQEVLQKLKDGDALDLCDIIAAGAYEGKQGSEARLAALIAWVTNAAGSDSADALLTQIRDNFSATILSNSRQKVEPLGKLGASRSFTLTTASAEVTLTPSCRRVRLTTTVNTDYRIGTGAIGPAVATDHLLLAGTSIDLCVDAGSKVAAIRDASATANGLFAITELVEP